MGTKKQFDLHCKDLEYLLWSIAEKNECHTDFSVLGELYLYYIRYRYIQRLKENSLVLVMYYNGIIRNSLTT